MRIGHATRALACAVALACATHIAMAEIRLAGARLPSTVSVNGVALVALSCGVRDTLWIDHYATVLYAAPGSGPLAAIDPRQPFAIAMRMIKTRYMPEQIPDKWLAALESVVPPRRLRPMRQAYRALADGDRVLIRYDPRSGVTIRVNRTVVARLSGHRAVDAVLQAWAEDEPVTVKLERLARDHPCPSRR